ncbi:MAG: prephenate dehydrogenase/arogenate dehydrogenase family protein [Chloroflexota bacterium]|nr:prephenate dehydrogenase/arogenate dehydrogenase family protein [Chloroflexota bacterium]
MKIGIAGLGMIGGSLALALRSSHTVTGFDTDPKTRDDAARAGIAMAERLEDLAEADAVIIATPVVAIVPTLTALDSHVDAAVLLDVGSVRAPVEHYVRGHPEGARIVGLHPMAGRSAHGFAAADPALLAGRPFLVVPTQRADARAMAVAGEIARTAGGVVTVCSASEHDRIVALVSGLPLALAAALSVAAAEGVRDLGSFAGPGFRDTTRVALTSLDLGEGMLRANAANVVHAIARFRGTLDQIEQAVADVDVAALRGILERAGQVRGALE